MKNSTVIFLSLLILLSLAISFMSLDIVGSNQPKYGDNADSSSNDKPDVTDKPTESSQTSNIATPSVYFYDNVGYETVGNVTYFFKVLELNINYSNCYIELHDYGIYSSSAHVKWGDGAWKLASSCSGYKVLGDMFRITSNLSFGKEIYVSYTAITDCVDPEAVLMDLYDKVFSDSDYFFATHIEPVGDVTQNSAS